MLSTAKTPEEYVTSTEGERGKALASLRALILENLPAGYEEVINRGMISYQVPLLAYPNTYNKQPLMAVALANQKNYLSLYLVIPQAIQTLRETSAQNGQKLKTGKSCINFNTLDELPLETLKTVLQKSELRIFLAAIEEINGATASQTEEPIK